MTLRRIIIAAVPALAILGCASAQERAATAPASRTASPQEIVAARQSAYQLSAAIMGNMKAAIEGGGDVSGQAYAARSLARWARILPAMFPESTAGVQPSKARPDIWTNKADFDAKAAAYAAAADRLAELAQANDKQGFADQHKATSATCAACHDRYELP